MVDYSKQLVAALKKILPTHYEMTLKSGLATPCISWQERNNADDLSGDTVGYSRISYTVKVWGNNIGDLQKYSIEIDKALRPLGFKRTAAGELYDHQSTMIQKILTYEALAFENY